MNQNRNGFELIIGAVVTYVLFRLWWNGVFEDWGIKLLAPYVPDGQYGNTSVIGTLLVEGINVLVGVGMLVTWVLSGIWAVLKDLLAGIAAAAAYFRANVDLPDWWSFARKVEANEPLDPRQAFAEQLVQAAISGDYVATVEAAEGLHGESFFPRAEESKPKTSSRRTES